MLHLLRCLRGPALFFVSCAAMAQAASSPLTAPAAPPAPGASQPAAAADGFAAEPPAGAPAAAASAVPGGGAAPPLQACAVKAFDDYATAMSVWEREWAEGVIDARPDFKAAVLARGKAHNSALQRDGFRIHYLAATAPGGLTVDESIASMRLFDWTPAQEQALRQAEPAYAEVADAADRDRAAADAQPKTQELEIYFEESFTDNAGAGAARDLLTLLNQGNGALEYCREHEAVTPPDASCPTCYGGPTGHTASGAATTPDAPAQPAAPPLKP